MYVPGIKFKLLGLAAGPIPANPSHYSLFLFSVPEKCDICLNIHSLPSKVPYSLFDPVISVYQNFLVSMKGTRTIFSAQKVLYKVQLRFWFCSLN